MANETREAEKAGDTFCQCKTWATTDLVTDLLGNGHHHGCQHYKANVGALDLLKQLVDGINFWASQEDGVPDELWDAYARAVFITTGRMVDDTRPDSRSPQPAAKADTDGVITALVEIADDYASRVSASGPHGHFRNETAKAFRNVLSVQPAAKAAEAVAESIAVRIAQEIGWRPHTDAIKAIIADGVAPLCAERDAAAKDAMVDTPAQCSRCGIFIDAPTTGKVMSLHTGCGGHFRSMATNCDVTEPDAVKDDANQSRLATIRPLTDDELHYVACEVDHDLKNTTDGGRRIRWNNHGMGSMLATIGSLKAELKVIEKLPLTRDLVRVAPGDRLYSPDFSDYVRVPLIDRCPHEQSPLIGSSLVSMCYSTLEAAREAAQIKGPIAAQPLCRCGRELVRNGSNDPDPWCSGCSLSASACDCVPVAAAAAGEGKQT